MNKLFNHILLGFGTLIFSAWLFAAEIILKDGSRVTGDIQSFHQGTYTIKSSSLGTIQISMDKIKSINYAAKSTTNSGINTPIQDIQNSLLANRSSMQEIKSLQSDPQIQAILKDADIMSAISRGDLQSLMNNPKIKQLMQNPKIKRLIEQVK